MRLDGIDVLRGLAVTAVVIYHFFILLELADSPVFPYVEAFGSVGVPLFFIISGYLIYRSIDRSVAKRGIKKGLINYAFHRLFRILPAYYFNLLIVFLLAAFVFNQEYYYSASFFRQFFAHLTFSSYFIHKSAGFGINGAYWTLGIEMLWYVVAPFFLLYVKSIRILIIFVLLSFLYIGGLDAGYLDSFFGLNPDMKNYRLLLLYYASQLPGQISYFIAGILVYKYALSPSIEKSMRNYMLALLLLLLFVGIKGYLNSYEAILPAHVVLLSVSVLLFLLLYTTKIKWGGVLEWIGKISYSLYLWHMPILFVMNKSHILEERSLLESVVFFLILLFSISSMSYYFIEEGGFALRERVSKHFFATEKEELV